MRHDPHSYNDAVALLAEFLRWLSEPPKNSRPLLTVGRRSVCVSSLLGVPRFADMSQAQLCLNYAISRRQFASTPVTVSMPPMWAADTGRDVPVELRVGSSPTALSGFRSFSTSSVASSWPHTGSSGQTPACCWRSGNTRPSLSAAGSLPGSLPPLIARASRG